MTPSRRLAVVLTLLSLPAVAYGQESTLTVPFATSPPVLSTFLSGELRDMDGRVTQFRQREPRDGEPVTRDTTAYVSFDSANLYVVFVCRDTPSAVRARLTRRERIDADDEVAVYLDTFHDRQRAYVFAANPLGVQAERIRTEGQDDDESFDTLWQTEGQLTAFGYVVKMTIPFRSLRFPNGTAQTWGIGLSRRIQRLNEEAYWPHVSKRAQGFVPQLGTLRGLRAISPGSNVQLIPYGVYTNAQLEPGGTAAALTERRIGLDAKLGLGTAFVLDAAINPDFSELESDEPQVTVNERFEVFFPERRPFFVENAPFFATPATLFFSRRLQDPRAGARVSGKRGRWVTAAVAVDDGPGATGEAATALVGTARREFAEDSHLGALVTLRRTPTGTNRVVSADGRVTLGETWAAIGQVMRSDGGTSGVGGTGYIGEISRNGRNFDVSVGWTDLSPGFSPDLGFVERVDIRQLDHRITYQWRPRGGPVVKFGPVLDGFRVWNHAGERLDWRIRPRFEVELVGQTSILVDRTESRELYRGLDFEKRRTTAEVSTEWLRWLALEAELEVGTDINRRPAAGPPVQADRLSTSVTATMRPGRYLQLDQTLLRTRLRVPDGQDRAGATIFHNTILRSKLNLQMSRALSVRTILDYDLLDSDAALSTLRPRRRLGLDLLGALQLNPGTALFVGYVEQYQPLAEDRPFTFLPALQKENRQFYVKVSWLMRY